MTEQDILQHWLKTAANDYQTAEDNIKIQHYDWAFFQYNLAIEKLLKGLVYKQQITPKFTHDLLELATTTKVPLSPIHSSYLAEINTYNISARYDDFKLTFYLKVTQPEYYTLWQQRCQEIYQWLKQQY